MRNVEKLHHVKTMIFLLINNCILASFESCYCGKIIHYFLFSVKICNFYINRIISEPYKKRILGVFFLFECNCFLYDVGLR